MPNCHVCEGSGWVQAAPISSPAPYAPKYYRRPIWVKAVMVPCFACFGRAA